MSGFWKLIEEAWPLLVLVGNYLQNKSVAKKIPKQMTDDELEDKLRGMFSKVAGAAERAAKKIEKNPLGKPKKSEGGV